VAGIEADERRSGDERIVREARVGEGVGDDERPVAVEGVRAEGHAARRLAPVQAEAGLVPLPVRVDQGDQRDRHGEGAPGDAGDAIEALLRRCIEEAQAADCR
jgi:hypothetical protein